MEKISVALARRPESVGKQVKLQGWLRTRRDSKAGFSFLEVNDGSCQGNLQVVSAESQALLRGHIGHARQTGGRDRDGQPDEDRAADYCRPE